MSEKNRIQGMVRSIDQYRNGKPEVIAEGSKAQIIYALEDCRHDILVLWNFILSNKDKFEVGE